MYYVWVLINPNKIKEICPGYILIRSYYSVNWCSDAFGMYQYFEITYISLRIWKLPNFNWLIFIINIYSSWKRFDHFLQLKIYELSSIIWYSLISMPLVFINHVLGETHFTLDWTLWNSDLDSG